MNTYIEKEIKQVLKKIPFIDKFNNCKILVTGGTGLIGSSIVNFLSYIKNKCNISVEIYATARNENKVKKMGFLNNINWIYKDLSDPLDDLCYVDYVIHTASPTSSSFFVEKPVETINSTVSGLNNLFSYSQKNKIKSFVFLSSMEVYGLCCDDTFIKENQYFEIDPLNVRNSYSEGKKILECLSCSYFSEYNVPVKIVRLAQTFGPGVSINDTRVFAQFAKSIINNEDIVISSQGKTKRSYCSIADAINGIFTVLINGENGNAYNLASDNSYTSIYKMAELFSLNTNKKIITKGLVLKKYLNTIKFGLDTTKIKTLGFNSIDNINTIVGKFLEYYKNLYKK